jgi:hypothetical protein
VPYRNTDPNRDPNGEPINEPINELINEPINERIKFPPGVSARCPDTYDRHRILLHPGSPGGNFPRSRRGHPDKQSESDNLTPGNKKPARLPEREKPIIC